MAHSVSPHTNDGRKVKTRAERPCESRGRTLVESLGGCDMHDPNHFPMHRASFIAQRLPQLEAHTESERTHSAPAGALRRRKRGELCWTRREREDDLYGRASCIIDLAEPIVIESCRAVGIFIFPLFISLCMHTQVSSLR
jgi:hypothetical protein